MHNREKIEIALTPVLRTGIESLVERHEQRRQQFIAANADIAKQNAEALEQFKVTRTSSPIGPHVDGQGFLQPDVMEPSSVPLFPVPEQLTFERVAEMVLARGIDDALAAYVNHHGPHALLGEPQPQYGLAVAPAPYYPHYRPRVGCWSSPSSSCSSTRSA
jgi:hypothetical protein